MSKQQTAVEWLEQEYKKWYRKGNPIILKLIKQANQMHKEQTKAAYNKGYQDGEIDSLDAKDGDVQYFEDAEQYYNETYGKSI